VVLLTSEAARGAGASCHHVNTIDYGLAENVSLAIGERKLISPVSWKVKKKIFASPLFLKDRDIDHPLPQAILT